MPLTSKNRSLKPSWLRSKIAHCQAQHPVGRQGGLGRELEVQSGLVVAALSRAVDRVHLYGDHRSGKAAVGELDFD